MAISGATLIRTYTKTVIIASSIPDFKLSPAIKSAAPTSNAAAAKTATATPKFWGKDDNIGLNFRFLCKNVNKVTNFEKPTREETGR